MAFDQALSPSLAACAGGVRTSCRVCPSRGACLAGLANGEAFEQWDAQQFPHVPLPAAGKLLFAAGDPATAIFVVRAGCLKTFTVDKDGNERVRGFHFPGDLVGLDALGAARYPSQAVAVTPAQVCRVTKGQLHRLQASAPALIENLLERISTRLQEALSLSGDYTADERVGAFLLQMHERAEATGEAEDGVQLPMTRRDIANYLRLATETVCRVLTRLERKRLLRSEDRRIHVTDLAALRKLAAPVGFGAATQGLQRAA